MCKIPLSFSQFQNKNYKCSIKEVQLNKNCDDMYYKNKMSNSCLCSNLVANIMSFLLFAKQTHTK